MAGLQIADPEFGVPGKIDLLLGTKIFSKVALHWRRFGPHGAPTTLKTHFGWVLSGTVCSRQRQSAETCCLTTVGIEDLMRKFWEFEDCNLQQPILSVKEKMVIQHIEETHSRDDTGRCIVPLPWKENIGLLGETRSLAVNKFRSLKLSLRSKGKFEAFTEPLEEYFQQNHAKPIPL